MKATTASVSAAAVSSETSAKPSTSAPRRVISRGHSMRSSRAGRPSMSGSTDQAWIVCAFTGVCTSAAPAASCARASRSGPLRGASMSSTTKGTRVWSMSPAMCTSSRKRPMMIQPSGASCCRESVTGHELTIMGPREERSRPLTGFAASCEASSGSLSGIVPDGNSATSTVA
jgi:hypothetical protein